MEERVVPFSALEITLADVTEAMGYGQHLPDDQTAALINRLLPAFEKIEPRYCLGLFDGVVETKSLVVGETLFHTGAAVAAVMHGAERFAAFVATAGDEYEQCRTKLVGAQGDILVQYVADAIGSAIAVKLGAYVERRLSEIVGSNHVSHHMSPGYCHWPIADQRGLFDLLGGNPCGVRLSEGCLMYPVKSLSGVMAIGEHVKQVTNSCDICPMVRCFRRHTSKRHPNKT